MDVQQVQGMGGWLFATDRDFPGDEGFAAKPGQSLYVTDVNGIARYSIVAEADYFQGAYGIRSSDGREVATISSPRLSSWHRAVMASGQVLELKPTYLRAMIHGNEWLRLRGMGLSLVPKEQCWPSADLLSADGALVARFEYETEGLDRDKMKLGYGYRELTKDDVCTRYKICIAIPGWEDVVVTTFAMIRHEYLWHVSRNRHADPFDYYVCG